MSEKRQKSKGPFGLSPLTWFAAACLLVIVGMSGGVILDIMLRPKPVRHASVSHHVSPPVIRTPEDIPSADDRMPSVLTAHPAPPQAAVHATPQIVPVIPPLPEKPTPQVQAVAVAPPPAPEAPSQTIAKATPSVAPILKEKKSVIAAAALSSGHVGPAIAIVIDDMGLDRVHTAEVIELPAGVSVSIMVYANDVEGVAARALGRGHEVLAHVPMQPLNAKEDPGPQALTVAMDSDTIRATLAAGLDKWDGFVGINNHMGSRFTVDSARMDAVMAELKSRGLLWLDSRTTTQSVGPGAAQAAGVPYVTRDIFLDNVDTVAAVLNEIEHTIAIAKSRGTAIAIGHPHANTIAALKQILPTLEGRGIALVPVSEVLKRQQARSRPS